MFSPQFSRVNQAGFSLVEVTIIIIVIGILAAVSIAAYPHMTQRASWIAKVDEAKQIQETVMAQEATQGQFASIGQSDFPDTAMPALDALSSKVLPVLVQASGSGPNYEYVYCGRDDVKDKYCFESRPKNTSTYGGSTSAWRIIAYNDLKKCWGVLTEVVIAYQAIPTRNLAAQESVEKVYADDSFTCAYGSREYPYYKEGGEPYMTRPCTQLRPPKLQYISCP